MSDKFAAFRNLPRLAPPPEKKSVPTKKITPPQKCKPNESCYCGSHKKYKKCCMGKAAQSSETSVQEFLRKNKELVRQMTKGLNLTGAP